jgi:thymidylate synthase
MKEDNIEHQYLKLLKDILDNGTPKQTRNGVTISVFGRQIRHDMKLGFPLLTTKKLHFKSIVGELLWFLKGSTDIRELWKDDIKIWDGDWYKNYETTCSEPYSLDEIKDKVKNGDHYFHDSMFDLGPIYGKQWRGWISDRDFDYGTEVSIDQITNLINNLKTNPDSRRLMVNAWNVGELDQMTLPPCHYGFQVYTRELSKEERYNWYKKNTHLIPDHTRSQSKEFEDKYVPKRAISLMWNQRSVDTFLGLPFNIASYGLLLEIIAREVNMVPDKLIGNLGDTHLYSNHIEQTKEQLNREPLQLPKLWCLDEYHYLMDEELVGPIPFNEKIEQFRPDFFTMHNYEAHPHIKAPLSN